MWILIVLLAAAPASHPRPKMDFLRVQVLLDRNHFSPGEIDGTLGRVTRAAILGFQTANHLAQTGRLDGTTLERLEMNQEGVFTLIGYTITDQDERGPFAKIPAELMDQAALPGLGYESPLQELGEKFHASPALLRRLNPGVEFSTAGVEIQVPNIHQDSPPQAATVVVSKSHGTVEALDAGGNIMAVYPATTGSVHDPLPIGNWKVTHVTRNPKFYYDPKLFWNAPSSDTKATIQPGPRNPVGVVWIGLTKEHYGIHGTPEPSLIGHAESHGCVRMTNWDASELAAMVAAGTPVVFKK
jgi:lipoprotein-anchoring transpeptidase ErfK/SrfK